MMIMKEDCVSGMMRSVLVIMEEEVEWRGDLLRVFVD
jgi:hypothetical protein